MIPEGFQGRAKRLDALDLPKIGKTIGVSEDEIRAVMEVESRGSGFDRQGRPTLLFEPHIFYRELSDSRLNRNKALSAGLAYASWGAKPYPKDSYPRLKAAMAIDETAALRSASWGLGQVMGFNHRAAGYDTVQAMVEAFCDDEENQLAGMIRFIENSGLADEIRRHDWAGFARGYNGAGFAKNRYDQRLAVAFAKWQKVKDTPFDISVAADEDAAAAKASETVSFVERAKVQAVQQRLKDLGYAMVGMADGETGPRTAAAIAAFETENGYPVTGQISDELVKQLETAEPHVPSEARAEGEPEGSRIVATGKSITNTGVGLSLTGAVAFAEPVLGQVEAAKGVISRLKDLVSPIKELVSEYWPVILLAIGGFMLWRGVGIVKARIEDFRRGKTA